MAPQSFKKNQKAPIHTPERKPPCTWILEGTTIEDDSEGNSRCSASYMENSRMKRCTSGFLESETPTDCSVLSPVGGETARDSSWAWVVLLASLWVLTPTSIVFMYGDPLSYPYWQPGPILPVTGTTYPLL